MTPPFLVTKFFIPRPHVRTVPRRALLRRLEDGRSSGVRLFYLSAPAGSGKTNLISEWVHDLQHGRPEVKVCWLSLDPADDDYQRFFSYLIASLQTADPGLGKNAAAVIQNPINVYQDESFLAELINDLALYPEELVIVLDDYQNVFEPKIQRSLGYMIDHIPTNVRFAILTRADPPLAFAHWQAAGQLMTLRGSDLRFSQEETEQYFNHVYQFGISPDEADRMNEKTDGWPAGHSLAALSFLESRDIHNQIAMISGSNRYILDYLVEEVISRLPEDVQEFLYRTSCLERLCADLCDAVSGLSNGQSMLAFLENHNLFLQPLDVERCWYRYYHLFSAIVQIRMRGRQDYEEDYRNRSLQASAWCEKAGYLHEAIGYALQASDTIRAADLIEQFSYTHFLPGGVSATMGQIRSLPEDIVLARPRLSLLKAWGFFTTGNIEASLTYLLCAEAAADPAAADILAEIHAFRALILVMKNVLAPAIQEARLALSLTKDEKSFIRAFTLFTLGLGCDFSGRLEEAEAAYLESYRLCLETNDVILTVIAGCQIGDIAYVKGRLPESEKAYHDILARLDQSTRNTPILGMLYASLARLYYEWNDLDTSGGYYQKCIELGTLWETQDILISGYLGMAQIALGRGNPSEAERYIQLAGRSLKNKMLYIPTAIVIRRNVIVKLAVRLGKEVEYSDQDDPDQLKISSPWLEIARNTRARIRMSQKYYPLALEDIEAGILSAEHEGRQNNAIELILLKALALERLSQTEAALDCLKEVLRRASRGKYLRSFLDEGEPLLRLLESVRGGGYPQDYLDFLLSGFAGEIVPSADKPGNRILINEYGVSLSSREAEVLGLIGEGCSNQEIAERLTVALSTVKTHVNNIFMKLNVESRTAALAKAKEHGLLDDFSTR